MEIRVIARGALAGFLAGVLGFVFAKIFGEPLIDRAIAFEDSHAQVLDKIAHALGPVPEVHDHHSVEISRDIQSTLGLATGIVGIATAFGALVAVAYLVLHGRTAFRPQQLVWLLCGAGFLGVFALPFVKYPANPPAVSNDDTIAERSELYLTLVIASLILLALAAFLAHRLKPYVGRLWSVVSSGAAFLVAYGVLIAVLPALGDLGTNKDAAGTFGIVRSATETPPPVINVLDTPLTIDGITYAPGQIIAPGFDADVLWSFRWYSLLEQVLIWTVLALVLGALVERYLGTRRRAARQELVAV